MTDVMIEDEKFTMEPVESSNIEAIGYNAESRMLVVQFKGGSYYRYKGVPPMKHASFMAVPSKGSHLATNIKGVYESDKVEAMPA